MSESRSLNKFFNDFKKSISRFILEPKEQEKEWLILQTNTSCNLQKIFPGLPKELYDLSSFDSYITEDIILRALRAVEIMMIDTIDFNSLKNVRIRLCRDTSDKYLKQIHDNISAQIQFVGYGHLDIPRRVIFHNIQNRIFVYDDDFTKKIWDWIMEAVRCEKNLFHGFVATKSSFIERVSATLTPVTIS